MLAPSPWGDNRAVRIGLLGGSFNPAHAGHRHVAEIALKRLGLDQVWLLVSPQNPLKPVAGMAPQAQRLDWANRVLAGHPRLIASGLEAHLGTTYSAHTLAKLRQRFPKARFVWLMGADNLAQMTRWRQWKRIFALVPIAILARSPYSRKALAAPAARFMAAYRQKATGACGLAAHQPPAWVFLHTRLHPASATALRAAHLKE